MTLSGEKYEKFIEQVKLGRDIIVGGDLSEITKYMMDNGYGLHPKNNYFESLPITEENLRSVLAEYIDRYINMLKDGGNMSLKPYPENNFYLTVKCSAREKSINVKWRRWRNDDVKFEKTFEIVI